MAMLPVSARSPIITFSTSSNATLDLSNVDRKSSGSGTLAFVAVPTVAPAITVTGTAAGTTAGTLAAGPVLATISVSVLVGAAAAWALTPQSQRAALVSQALVTARQILNSVPGLSSQQRAGYLQQIKSAFSQGISAVKGLANQWRNIDMMQHRAPGREPEMVVPPGQRRGIETSRNGAVTGRPAQELERQAARKYAEKVKQAADEAYRQITDPFNRRSMDQIVSDVSSRRGVSAEEVSSALTSLDHGSNSAQGIQAISKSQKKAIIALIKQAGLEIVVEPHQSKRMHIKAILRNRFGEQRMFVFPSTPSDQRWERNSLTALKRFARSVKASE